MTHANTAPLMCLVLASLGAACTSTPAFHIVGEDFDGGSVRVRVARNSQIEADAWLGRIGCTEFVDGRALVLESCSGMHEKQGQQWIEFVARPRERIPQLTDRDVRWFERGPVLHVFDAARYGSGSAEVFGFGVLARVVCEGRERALCLLLQPRDVEVGTYAWGCRPELSNLLAEMQYPPYPFLVGDPVGSFGKVESVSDRYVTIRNVDLSEELVELQWRVSGDARLDWQGRSLISPRAWALLGGQALGPLTLGAGDDVVIACTGMVARHVGLVLNTYVELVVRCGDEVVLEGVKCEGRDFAVACRLRAVLAEVRESYPNARRFSCELRVYEPVPTQAR